MFISKEIHKENLLTTYFQLFLAFMLIPLFLIIVAIAIQIPYNFNAPPVLPSTGSQKVALQKRVSLLNEMINKGQLSDIYDTFVSLDTKKEYESYYPDYKNYFLQIMNEYYSHKRIVKTNLAINSITIRNNEGFVDRSVDYCYSDDCQQKLHDNAVIKWVYESNNWYTTQEQPLCIRESPFNSSSSIEGVNKVILNTNGIEINWNIECDMFPVYFLVPPINTNVAPLSNSDVYRSKRVIEDALQKYPVNLLKNHLKRVYLLDSLQNFGVNYGGTNALRTIYITNSGVDNGYSDDYIEQMFHHEFSSMLLRDLDKYYDHSTTTWNNPTWASFNDKSFKYGTGGIEETRQGKNSQQFDSYYLKQGFLNQYSTSSMENDFNEVVMNMFVGSKEFWHIVDTNQKIRQKVDFVIRFYQSLDPKFTETYFRSLVIN